MASPVADSYSVGSGTIYAGMSAPAAAPWSGRKILFGDSLTDTSYPSGGYRWGDPLSGSPLLTISNAGITNNTLDDMWTRWATDVLAIATAGDVVEMRAGTNSLALDLATFQTSYARFITSCASNSLKLLILAIPPKSGITGSEILAKNAWLAAQAAANPDEVAYIDDSIDLGDGSYTYIAASYIDGIHMNGLGVYQQGTRQTAPKVALFAANDPRPTSGTDTYYIDSGSTQWVKNPLMAGTSGGMSQATGTVPTDWGVSCTGSGTAAVCSIVASVDSNTTPWLRVAISTIGGVSHALTVSAGLAHPAVAADTTVKRLDVVVQVRLNSLDTSKVSNLKLYCLGGSTNVAPPLQAYAPGTTISDTLMMRTSLPRTHAGQALAAHGANTISCLFEVLFTAASASSIGSIDFRCASVRALGT